MRVSAAEHGREVLRGAQFPQVSPWQRREHCARLCVCTECCIEPGRSCCTRGTSIPWPQLHSSKLPAARGHIPRVRICTMRGHGWPGAPFPALPLVTLRAQHVLARWPQPQELSGRCVLPGLMAQHKPRRRAETGKISYAQTLLNDLANSSFPSLFVPEYILFVNGKVSS